MQPDEMGTGLGQILMFGEANQFDLTRCLHWVFLSFCSFERLNFGVVVLLFFSLFLCSERNDPGH